MGNKGVGERACTGNDLTPAEEDQELGYYQKKKMEARSTQTGAAPSGGDSAKGSKGPAASKGPK